MFKHPKFDSKTMRTFVLGLIGGSLLTLGVEWILLYHDVTMAETEVKKLSLEAEKARLEHEKAMQEAEKWMQEAEKRRQEVEKLWKKIGP